MSPVEFWKSCKWLGSIYVEDVACIFRNKANIVLVENQQEEDYVWALQLIYGMEVCILHYDRGTTMREYRMKTTGVVYCTWDPSDRNRI